MQIFQLSQQEVLSVKSRGLSLLFAVALSFLLIFAAVKQERYRIVLQKDYSLDLNVGFLDKQDRAFSKGDIVAFKFLVVGDKKYNQDFMKKVGCNEGDIIERKGLDFYCNGVFISRAKTHDKKGNPTQLFDYSGAIPAGKFFAIGDHIDSYDSKYWGFADANWVFGKVKKII